MRLIPPILAAACLACAAAHPARAQTSADSASLARAMASVVADSLVPRVPDMVDTSGFRLGENIAATTGAVVFSNEVLEMIHYRPQ